jgi:putative FmdB family regulatory protein
VLEAGYSEGHVTVGEREQHQDRFEAAEPSPKAFIPKLKGTTIPIYEFECPNGTITEKLVRIDTMEIECPRCHKMAKRIISHCGFQLKGGGWFADGYSSKNERKRNPESDD